MRVLRIKDLKDLSVYREAADYRHAGPNGPEEMFFLTSPGGPPQTKHCYPPNPYNLANRDTLENLAHLWLQALAHANARGGQAPALRAREGFSSPCAVREQALPKLQSPAPILLILEILKILLQILLLLGLARDRPSPYGEGRRPHQPSRGGLSPAIGLTPQICSSQAPAPEKKISSYVLTFFRGNGILFAI